MKEKDVVKWKWDFWLLNINEMEAYCSKINCCRDFEIHAYIQIFYLNNNYIRCITEKEDVLNDMK